MIVYLIVGGVIGVVATGVVWLAGQVFTLDALAYGILVAVIYFIGAVVSFIAHSRITFRVKVRADRFVRHLGVAGGSALATGLISSIVRSFMPGRIAGFRLDAPITDAFAFIAASLIVAAGSYFLSKMFVFRA